MKILIISQYYFPEEFRINDIAKELVKQGNRVVVLTGLPNYPSGRIYKGFRFFKKRKETVDGVKIIRSFEIARRKNIFFLFLNYLSFMISASFKIFFIKRDYDIIFSYQLSPVTMVVPAVLAKKISKKPLYIYSCDIWPESIKNIIKKENSILYKITKKLSTYVYRQANHIGITSKPFINYFMNVHNINIANLSYIPQHAESEYLKISESIDNKVFDFVFLGNIGIAQDIECIINATRIINKNLNFKVHFVGDGSFLKQAKQLVKDYDLLDYVVFHGRHPIEDMPRYYKLADACLITLKGDNLIGSTVPSKLQGYMAAGRPVLGAINGAAQDIIIESGCGVCVNAGEYKSLAREMEQFILNQTSIKDLGRKGRRYFEQHFSLEKYIESIFLDFLKILEVNEDV